MHSIILKLAMQVPEAADVQIAVRASEQVFTSFRLDIRALLISSVDNVCLFECRINFDASCLDMLRVSESLDSQVERQHGRGRIHTARKDLDDLPQSDFKMRCQCISGFRSDVSNSYALSKSLHD